jgi:hypothetical protein
MSHTRCIRHHDTYNLRSICVSSVNIEIYTLMEANLLFFLFKFKFLLHIGPSAYFGNNFNIKTDTWFNENIIGTVILMVKSAE